MYSNNGKHYEAEKPVYDDSYDRKLEESYERMKDRPSFRYEAASDPLYKKYKTDYIAQGRLAMRDSAGQASQLSGGYGSSYAQNVGRQSYDRYLSKLTDLIPELMELAYQGYDRQTQRMQDEFSSLSRLRDNEISRYNTELSEYNTQRDNEYKKQQEEEKTAKDKAAQLAKYGDFSGYASLYGDDTAETMKNYWISSQPRTAYNMGLIDAGRYYALTGEYAPGYELPAPNGTYSGRTYPGTAPDGRDARLVQQELRAMGFNIAVDGAWGPKSQAAWDKVYGTGSGGWVSYV